MCEYLKIWFINIKMIHLACPRNLLLLHLRFDVASRVADNDESKFIGENMEPVPSHMEGREAIVIEDIKKTFTAFRD